jgi:MFS family permease
MQCAVPKVMLPMLTSATMLATTVTALTVGRFAKGRGIHTRNVLLIVGFLVLLGANLFLGAPLTANPVGMFVACALIGIHMGMTHGLTLSMVSSYMPLDDLPGAAPHFTAAKR